VQVQYVELGSNVFDYRVDRRRLRLRRNRWNRYGNRKSAVRRIHRLILGELDCAKISAARGMTVLPAIGSGAK
jgi:hypothetical protein